MFASFEGLGEALRAKDQSLARLNEHPAIIYLRSLIVGGRRLIRLGFGQNLSVQVSAGPIKNGTEEGSEEDEQVVLDRLGVLLMLNLHSEQQRFEKKFSQELARRKVGLKGESGKGLLDVKTAEEVIRGALQESSAGETPLQEEVASKNVLLANTLLELFEVRSGTVLIDRTHPIKPGHQQSFVRIALEAFEDTELSLNKCFRYSPSYLVFGDAQTTSEETLARSVDEISKSVLENFYGKLSQADYMMDEFLKEKLYPHLYGFVKSGIVSQRQGFRASVQDSLSLFLHGTPGIGKSTFVQVFAASLQRALREQLSPDIEVNIVKIPLNAYLNAWNLNQILQIQGISDWSVERMMEQALTKGHIVVLHLEECPASFELQDSLFVCLQKMLERKLWFRYPEFKSNVVFVFTSNYGPSPTISNFCREYCTLNPPTAEMQKQWLKRKLETALTTMVVSKRMNGTSGSNEGGGMKKVHEKQVEQRMRAFTAHLVDVEIDPQAFPVATKDVRPLNAWWISLGYALGKAIPSELLLSNIGGPKALKAFVRSGAESRTLEIGWEKTSTPLQTVTSDDGFFYYDPSMATTNQNQLDAKTRTILSMCLSGDLTPAVIVLRGEANQQWVESMETFISKEIQSMIAQKDRTSFVSTRVVLLSAEDESKVLGDPGEIRGGLFKFIDDATNPNSSFKQQQQDTSTKKLKLEKTEEDVCLVMAHVNEIGSTFLRELLESGDKSRTHRLGISKRGLLFVVSLVEGAELTPQLESRAHQILCVDSQ